MSSLVCAVCGQTAEPAAHIGTIAICSACGASNTVDAAGTVRRATAQDTASLSTSELQQLTKARAAIARADRQR